MHGIAGCGKTACPVVTEGLSLVTGHSILYLLRSVAERRRNKSAIALSSGGYQNIRTARAKRKRRDR